ncbi:MAG: hypothetical protein M3496_01465, partial [Pseudomonadota bacterium]|nr:hypothetical protein [Pseudomonadota bacterium]
MICLSVAVLSEAVDGRQTRFRRHPLGRHHNDFAAGLQHALGKVIKHVIDLRMCEVAGFENHAGCGVQTPRHLAPSFKQQRVDTPGRRRDRNLRQAIVAELRALRCTKTLNQLRQALQITGSITCHARMRSASIESASALISIPESTSRGLWLTERNGAWYSGSAARISSRPVG